MRTTPPPCEQNLTDRRVWGRDRRKLRLPAVIKIFFLPVNVDNHSSRTDARCERGLISVNRL